MLIVVEDRNVEFFFEPLFNLKTAWRGDILQIYAAEGGSDRFHSAHYLVRIFGVQTDGKGVNAGEFLKQHCLPFHHRQSRSRTDVAEASDRGTIAANGHSVRPDVEVAG